MEQRLDIITGGYSARALSAFRRGEWSGNFRDLAASVTRMAVFSRKGRVDRDCVEAEIARLKRLWGHGPKEDELSWWLSSETLAVPDRFDRVQLSFEQNAVGSWANAIRGPRARRTSSNDADRLRKYLKRFCLQWSSVAGQ